MQAEVNKARRTFAAWLGVSALGGILPSVSAAEAPLDLVKVILGVPAGSTVDLVARTVAECLKTGGYAQNAIVENRTGASGIIAVSAAKAARPDGGTVLVAASSPITVYPSTYHKLPYDPDKDLMPVSTLVMFDLVLAVGAMVPDEVTNLKAYFAWCRRNPSKASFGSPAAGSMPHFLGSMTARDAGVDLQHIPYRGPAPAVNDLIGGRVSAVVVPLEDVMHFAKAGKCRILAITGERRSRFVPDVPTFQEQGLGRHAMRVWIAAFVPAGTPQALVDRLGATLKQGLAQPAVTAVLEGSAQDVQWCDPKTLQARIHTEQASWAAAAKALHFTAEV